MNQQLVFTVDGLTITLTRRPRQKNTYIRINPPDGNITVSAPESMTLDDVKALVRKNMPAILKAVQKFHSQPRQPKREYVSGETCCLWGKQFMLRVIHENCRPRVEKFPDMIRMYVPEGTPLEKRCKILNDWYRLELKFALPRLIHLHSARIGVWVTDCSVRNMRTRWGSCNTRDHRILLNLQLVKRPYECLEYVVIHELVHLLERNHTRRFWSLVEKFCPNWKSARDLLNSQPLDF
ncbi:MAG: M48 family metallopeptidase [Synergistaceae bacterium]|nr:M48 family metallopeptidase [Synergistaceae bacterium]